MRFLLSLAMLFIFSVTMGMPGQQTSINQIQEQRYQQLLGELRCLVCQNQSLADSNAPLAQDLKKEVHDRIIAGQTDEEIKKALVAQYGEYILFKPQLTKVTLILWLGPLVFLVGAFIILWLTIRRQTASARVIE